MVELGEAELFFYIGVPFENIWLGRISKVNPQMKLVDTRRGIKLLPMKTGSQKTSDSHVVDKTAGLKDPHIWMSLRLVKIQAQNICEALINHDPVNKDYYQNNLRAFILDLDSVDAELIESLKDIRSRKFMVFHPAWGYFARDYGLEQIPIEIRGKAPGAKVLADLIDKAKKDRIKIIFVQKQFSKKSAEALAHAIGGKTIQIDPLAMDYLNNMKIIAENLKLQFGNYE
jgi:zinc transport system substrate-binding protein